MKLSLSSLVIPPWVRIAWKAFPWTIVLVLAGSLHLTRGTLHEVRMQDKLRATQSELASKTQELKWASQLSDSQSDYLKTLNNLSTIKDQSDEDTRAFAATPAGAVDCLSLDRVRSALSYRSAIEAAASPEGGSGEVSTGSDPAKGSQRK